MNKLIIASLLAIGVIGANAAFADSYRNQHSGKHNVQSGQPAHHGAQDVAHTHQQTRIKRYAHRSNGNYAPAQRHGMHLLSQHSYQGRGFR